MDGIGNGPRILVEIPLGSLCTVKITQTTLSSFVVMIVLIALSAWLGKGLQKRPTRRQVLVEKGVAVLDELVCSTMGAHNRHFVPYIGALFCSSVLGTLISLFGGVFRSATADLSTTVTWALITSVMCWYYNIKANGFFGWLKGFAEPVAVMTPMNIISEIAQPISMSFRHFGNIAGGGVLTSLIYGALAALSRLLLGWIPNKILSSIPLFQVGIPAFLSIYFDLFSGFVQALVFVLLTMIYVGSAIPAPEEAKQKTV